MIISNTYINLYKSICEYSPGSSDLQTCSESKRNYSRAPMHAQNLQRNIARKSQYIFGNPLWMFKIKCSYKNLYREEMFFT